jgi:prepilin-type N-terminal cleavage/methylation domain-containing protein
MRTSTRRGFTLVELLVAITVFGIVSTAIYGLLVRTQRLSRTQAERAIMQGNVRTGLALITSELRELNVDTTNGLADIYSMSPTAIEYRGMRGLGFVCAVDDDEIKVPQGTWNGYRDPDGSRDALLLFVENDPDKANDDGWTTRDFTASPSTCVVDGTTLTAWEFDLGSIILDTDTLPMVTLGSPVRTFERMEIGAVSADGNTWLGARSVSGGEDDLSPVLGPLAAGGVDFEYWPGLVGTGSETSTLTAVRTIRLRLVGITENIVAAGAGTTAWQRANDTLITFIRLRNAP